MTKVHIIPVLYDNYAYVLEAENGEVGVIDPGEAAPILSFVNEKSLKPTHLFLTHHHEDHVAGVKEIKETFGCQVYGPEAEAEKISLLDIGLTEDSNLTFGHEDVEVISTPGHTLGHINFYFSDSHYLFSGDTLFVLGCGRVFEGTMEQMYHSLQKLARLPDDTKIYCGHEYTLTNAKFLLSVDPENTELKQRYIELQEMRDLGQPTVPSLMNIEKETNLFLKANNIETFTRLRSAKDSF